MSAKIAALLYLGDFRAQLVSMSALVSRNGARRTLLPLCFSNGKNRGSRRVMYFFATPTASLSGRPSATFAAIAAE